MTKPKMEAYYAQRAVEYDRIYTRPERQSDLAALKTILSERFQDLNILEIACGSGYWTQFIAKSARLIHATDYNTEMLQMAAKRDYSKCLMSFAVADAYNMPEITSGWTAGFAGFLWSHVPISRRSELICSFHSRLADGASVVWLDNRYVEGSNTPIRRQDTSGNTYQMRRLEDGSRHEVIKNFPSEDELIKDFEPFCENIRVELFQYYWLLSYNVSETPRVFV